MSVSRLAEGTFPLLPGWKSLASRDARAFKPEESKIRKSAIDYARLLDEKGGKKLRRPSGSEREGAVGIGDPAIGAGMLK